VWNESVELRKSQRNKNSLRIMNLFLCIFFFFRWGRGWELRALHCKAGSLSLEPHLQFILLWLFWRWGLVKYFSWLASNCHPPNQSEPPASSAFYIFEAEPYYVAQATNLWSSCLSLSSARITGLHHHVWHSAFHPKNYNQHMISSVGKDVDNMNT
jgi:hypothetical protein